MGLSHEHDLHRRRLSRNAGVGIVLGAFVLLVFVLTIAKLVDGQPMQANDHALRLDKLEASE